jgi:hypothetical protein
MEPELRREVVSLSKWHGELGVGQAFHHQR